MSFTASRYREWRSTERGKACRERSKKKYFRTVRGKAHRMVSAARNRAKRQGREFTITPKDILPALEAGVCQVSKIPFEMQLSKRGPYSPSIDRIDSSKGYTPDNVQIVLWAYNAMRGDWGDEVVHKIIKSLWLNDLRFQCDI